MDSLALTSEEQQLFDSLRSKHRHGSDTSCEAASDQGPGVEQRGQQAQTASSASIAAGALTAAGAPASSGSAGITLCPVCQGSGRVSECYHHRVMERSCDHCGSQGVMLAGQQAGQADSGAGAPAAPVRSSGARPGGGAAAAAAAAAGGAAEAAPRGQEDLRRDVALIDARLGAYRKELAAAQQLLDGGGSGAEQQALARQLADALEGQMARLERSRLARLRLLAGGRAGGGAEGSC